MRDSEDHDREPESGADIAGDLPRWRMVPTVAIGVIALVVAAGIGFGITSAVRGPGKPADSAIPAPPARNSAFVADDDGTGQDNQENAMTVTGPGLVHILGADGQPAGLGIVLTRSGKVLTAAQVVGGAKSLTAQFVLSGKSYTTSVIGSDAGADVALLQLKGGSDFPVAAVGTSRGLYLDELDTALGSPGTGKAVNFNLCTLKDVHGAVTVGGRTLTGLLHESGQVALTPAAYAGGPLVNLTGHVIGVDVAGTGHRVGADMLAIPINTALAVATRIDSGQG
jgi:S1-C subfamily serine protease